MSLNQEEIARIVGELSDCVVGARVQKIHQPTDDLLLLRLHRPGRPLSLLISVERQRARLHLTERRYPRRETPPAFCMLLRKELVGRRIVEIVQSEEDRIVVLRFSTRGEEAPPGLVLELFGRTGNVFLLDGEDRIRGVLRPALARNRGFLDGRCYAEPEPSGVGVSYDARAFDEHEGDYNQKVDAHFALQTERDALDPRLSSIIKALRREGKRKRKLLDDVARERERCLAHEQVRREAELLKANLHLLPAKAVEVFVDDFQGGRALIELDPRYPIAENADRLFKKARKLARGLKRLEETGETAERALARIEDLMRRAESAAGGEDLEALAADVAALAVPVAKKREPGGKRSAARGPSGPHRFLSGDGREILVGRSDRENDRLTFRVARGNDYFFHARGAAGSHVILRLERNDELSEASLLDAAHLALFYSRLRHAGSGEVTYTRCKYVRKPKGSAPGKAAVSQEKTIRIRMESARMERLFASRA